MSRVVAAIMCLSIAGLPFGGGLSSVCFGGTVPFQDHSKHRMCSCASANCIEGACCCGHHGNAGFNMCGCGDTNLVFLLSGTQPATAGQNSLRAPFFVEAFEVSSVCHIFRGGKVFLSLRLRRNGCFIPDLLITLLTLPIDQAIAITARQGDSSVRAAMPGKLQATRDGRTMTG